MKLLTAKHYTSKWMEPFTEDGVCIIACSSNDQHRVFVLWKNQLTQKKAWTKKPKNTHSVLLTQFNLFVEFDCRGQ